MLEQAEASDTALVSPVFSECGLSFSIFRLTQPSHKLPLLQYTSPKETYRHSSYASATNLRYIRSRYTHLQSEHSQQRKPRSSPGTIPSTVAPRKSSFSAKTSLLGVDNSHRSTEGSRGGYKSDQIVPGTEGSHRSRWQNKFGKECR